MVVVLGDKGFEVRKGESVLFVGKTLSEAKAFYMGSVKPKPAPVKPVYRPTHFEPGDEMEQIYASLTDEELRTGKY